MRAAVIGAGGSMSIERVEDPTPGPGELLLRSAAAGYAAPTSRPGLRWPGELSWVMSSVARWSASVPR
jgi:hypothetical protein